MTFEGSSVDFPIDVLATYKSYRLYDYCLLRDAHQNSLGAD